MHKTLGLIEHLVKFGSNACVSEIRENTFKIRMLSDFTYREGSVERGAGIRDKAKYVATLLSDHQLLEQEREQAKRNLNKYIGIGSEDFRDGNGYYNRLEYRREEPSYSARSPQEQRIYSEPAKQNIDIFSVPEVKQVVQQPPDLLGTGSKGMWSGMNLRRMDIFGDTEGANQTVADHATLSQSQFTHLPPAYETPPAHPTSFPQYQPVKINSNFSGTSSGPAISQLHYNPTINTQSTPFQSAPPPQQPVDLEFKLFNLDNLRSGQPKQEQNRSSWF